MVNKVTTVRKLLFQLFCHVGFVLGVSINTHVWDGSTDFSDEPPWRCLSVLSKGSGGRGGGGGGGVSYNC